MLRPVWKKCLLLAALMVAGVTLSGSPAQAGWGHHRAGGCGWYGYGSYPAYVYTTSFCSPCVTSCGGAWGSPFWSGCYSGWYSGLYVGGYAGYYNSYYTPGYGSYGVASGCCDSVAEPQGAAGTVPTPAPPAAGDPAAVAPAREPASVLPTPPPPSDSSGPGRELASGPGRELASGPGRELASGPGHAGLAARSRRCPEAHRGQSACRPMLRCSPS